MHPTGSAAAHDSRSTWGGSHGSRQIGGPAIRCRQHGREQPHDAHKHPSTHRNLATPREPPGALGRTGARRRGGRAGGRAVRSRPQNVREAADLAILWGMVVVVVGLTGLDEEDFWPGWALVVAIAATITVVAFVVRTVGWAETTRVEVHPHEIVKEAVSWWRRSPTRVAIGFDEITSVDLDNEDGRKLLKVQASGRTLSGIPDGPRRAAALAIGQRLVAHGRAHTIQNDDTRIHLRLDGSSWPTY